MKRFALWLALCAVVYAPRSFAQDHFAVGAYVDYFHLTHTNPNFAWIWARAGFGLTSHVMLEGEMNYDFNQAFNEDFSDGATIAVQRSIRGQPLKTRSSAAWTICAQRT